MGQSKGETMSTVNLYPGALKVETVKCPHCGEKAEYSAGRYKAFLRCRDCGYEHSWYL